MKIRMFIFASIASVTMAFPVMALDLAQARSSGAVGEKPDGYMAALQNDPAASALVAQINAKRQQEYAGIAQKSGQPVAVVAKLAAPQIINGLPAGSAYQMPNGSWKKR